MGEPPKYPYTNTFVNLRGLQDSAELDAAELLASTHRLHQFHHAPKTVVSTASYDLDHLRAIHSHLFQDIYIWAGETRSYHMSKHFLPEFTPPEKIEPFAEYIRQEIREDNLLFDTSLDYAAKQIARYWGLLNILHPFPEGNGRTQRAFLWQLAEGAGYSLDWRNVEKWENTEASQRLMRDQDLGGMEVVIERVLVPL